MTLAVIATTPVQMTEAQVKVKEWADAKLAAVRRELSTAEQVFDQLQRAGLRTNPASTQIRHARNRIAYYEKVKLALDAGYYIIPPFDVQLFALRVDKAPPSELGTRTWERDAGLRSLPAQEGAYVNPRPDRVLSHENTKKLSDGREVTEKVYENADWGDMELPVRALKPELIDATIKALGLKVFDALGIAPAYRNADPMIVGQIANWQKNKRPLTFFVAWWLDESDL